MSIDPGLVLLALGPAAGLALVVLIATLLRAPPGRERARPWRTTALMSLTLLIAGNFARASLLQLQVPHLAYLTEWLAFLVGPCLWLYTCRVTGLDGPRGQRLAVHLIPAAAMLLVLLPSWFDSAEVKRAVLNRQLMQHSWPDVLTVVMAMHMLAYWMLGSLRLRRHVATLAGGALSEELRWFERLLSRFRMCWLAWAVWVATGLVWLPRSLT